MYVRRTHPEAYLLTWTAYGTWLAGDARGSTGDDHNKVGAPHAEPDGRREGVAADLMRHESVTLNGPMRAVVEATIREHCELKGWRVRALNVRTNPVHVVVDCGACEPDAAMEQFKSWATRRLRGAGLVGADRPVWTRRGSTRYLWEPAHVDGAIGYVMEGQGEDLRSGRRGSGENGPSLALRALTGVMGILMACGRSSVVERRVPNA
jgi:REP element-mobilizing transposase RayT